MEEIYWKPDVYADIPTPYAVFKVLLSDDGTSVENTQYVYVNQAYCHSAKCRREDLLGRCFFDVYQRGDMRWLEYCWQAMTTGQAVHDSIYSPEIHHWLTFTVAPLTKRGYVAFSFMDIDDERLEQMNLRRKRLTNEAILKVSKILTGDESYDDSMNHALKELGTLIHPDRLYILETDGQTISNTFEWCASGVSSEIATLQSLDYHIYVACWENFLENSSLVLIDDVEVLKAGNTLAYEDLKRQGIERLIAVPFYRHQKLWGYLVADNYETNHIVNTADVLETISFFISAKITNHRLMEQLDYLSCYDALTGIQNRNAYTRRIVQLQQHPGSLGVIFIDLNGLKSINDHQGHLAGDTALQAVASLLSECFGADDTYRTGGDEFVIFLPAISQADFRGQLPRLRNYIARHSQLSLAVGGQWTEDTAHILETIHAADNAMYRDKEAYYRRIHRKQHHHPVVK